MQRTRTRLLISMWAVVLFILPGCIFDTSGPEPSALKEFGVYDLGLDSDMELIDSEVRDLPDSGEPDLEDAAPPDLADAAPPDVADMGPADLPDMGVVDIPVADMPVPDVPLLDMSDPDFPVPDMPVPDMPVPDLPMPDKSVPDMMLPDQAAKIDTGLGGPCPCSAGQVCIYKVCRVKCTRDSCRQASTCSASEACIQQGQNLGCVPGLSTYAPCQSQPFGCPQGQYCAKNTGGTYQCLPLCTQSSPTCPCTKLGGTSCSVCKQ